MKLKGWGGYPELDVNVSNPNLITQIQEQIKQKNNLIARGNGRSYGDSSISKANTISMLNFDKILSFDKETGELVAESGVLLKNIIEKTHQTLKMPLKFKQLMEQKLYQILR